MAKASCSGCINSGGQQFRRRCSVINAHRILGRCGKLRQSYRIAFLIALALCAVGTGLGADPMVYEVGPGRPFEAVGEVPWEALEPGDTVLIHARPEPYREKWVICRAGTEDRPITVRGVPGPDGQLPVIDGRDAVTRAELNYWNEPRSIVKIGGANNPPDTLPEHIVIEGLEVRSARPGFMFTGRAGEPETYLSNAAPIFVEKGRHITIRNCVLHDSGNGLFISSGASEVLVEGCYIYDNGIEGSIYEHNSYTQASGLTFQFNRYGRLREGCRGNNLKDRSSGLVVRYNWIEGGNRQLDLVDAGAESPQQEDPRYRETFVYGNILVDPGEAGNNQMVHYGGDSADVDRYRKGTLFFFNNTALSLRPGNTVLMRLSTGEESAVVRNNIVHVTAGGRFLALLTDAGRMMLGHNWLTEGWRASHGQMSGTIEDEGTNLAGDDPGFVSIDPVPLSAPDGGNGPRGEIIERDLRLLAETRAVGAAGPLPEAALPAHAVTHEYVPHCGSRERTDDPAGMGALGPADP